MIQRAWSDRPCKISPMLTADQKRLIAEEASLATRLSWSRVNPRQLGELAAEVAHRAAQGTLNTPTFSEYADALRREPHAERVFQRDTALDALLDDEHALLGTLRLIEEMQGPEGVVSFATEHQLDIGYCSRLLNEQDRGPVRVAHAELALGD